MAVSTLLDQVEYDNLIRFETSGALELLELAQSLAYDTLYRYEVLRNSVGRHAVDFDPSSIVLSPDKIENIHSRIFRVFQVGANSDPRKNIYPTVVYSRSATNPFDTSDGGSSMSTFLVFMSRSALSTNQSRKAESFIEAVLTDAILANLVKTESKYSDRLTMESGSTDQHDPLGTEGVYEVVRVMRYTEV